MISFDVGVEMRKVPNSFIDNNPVILRSQRRSSPQKTGIRRTIPETARDCKSPDSLNIVIVFAHFPLPPVCPLCNFFHSPLTGSRFAPYRQVTFKEGPRVIKVNGKWDPPD